MKDPDRQRMPALNAKEVLESLLLPTCWGSNQTIDLSRLQMTSEAVAVAEEFTEKLSEKLNQRPSRLYRLATGTPVPYKIVPARIRNLLMRTKTKDTRIALTDRLRLEQIRTRFLDAVHLKYEANQHGHICLLSHDVESERGLRRALRLKQIEEKRDVHSTWFLPSDEYVLNRNLVRRLAENGEVASHGTTHDGRLHNLPREEAAEELRKGKEKLEEIVEREITGFRSPLLQYNWTILRAVSEAGYKYDSSMPTWEPVHPMTMRPDGIELLGPIKLSGILEIPITLPQDYQMLHILKLTPKQTVGRWVQLMDEVASLGGASVLLIHPDYEFASNENLEHYDELLELGSNMGTLGEAASRSGQQG